jgi:hypothetical protein
LERDRHPSHLDKQRDPTELAQQLRSLEGGYPIGFGPLFEVRTDIRVNQKQVVDKVRQMLEDDPLSV